MTQHRNPYIGDFERAMMTEHFYTVNELLAMADEFPNRENVERIVGMIAHRGYVLQCAGRLVLRKLAA